MIRYFGYELLDNKFVPGVVIGYKNRFINATTKVECYVVILYTGTITSYPIKTTEIKISRGLDPVLRDLLTELCNSYIKKENLEKECKLADIHFNSLCSHAFSNAKKFKENGYKISVCVMATDMFESRLSCYEREANTLLIGLFI